MSQKINPISVRIKKAEQSQSSWFSDYYYSNIFVNDLNLLSLWSSISRTSGTPSRARSRKKTRLTGRRGAQHWPSGSISCSIVEPKTNRSSDSYEIVELFFGSRSHNQLTPLADDSLWLRYGLLGGNSVLNHEARFNQLQGSSFGGENDAVQPWVITTPTSSNARVLQYKDERGVQSSSSAKSLQLTTWAFAACIIHHFPKKSFIHSVLLSTNMFNESKPLKDPTICRGLSSPGPSGGTSYFTGPQGLPIDRRQRDRHRIQLFLLRTLLLFVNDVKGSPRQIPAQIVGTGLFKEPHVFGTKGGQLHKISNTAVFYLFLFKNLNLQYNGFKPFYLSHPLGVLGGILSSSTKLHLGQGSERKQDPVTRFLSSAATICIARPFGPHFHRREAFFNVVVCDDPFKSALGIARAITEGLEQKKSFRNLWRLFWKNFTHRDQKRGQEPSFAKWGRSSTISASRVHKTLQPSGLHSNKSINNHRSALSEKKELQPGGQNSMTIYSKRAIKGIRVSCSGRINGAEIAKTEWKQFGQLRLHVFEDKIDYACCKAHTEYGILGIKVWVSYI